MYISNGTDITKKSICTIVNCLSLMMALNERCPSA